MAGIIKEALSSPSSALLLNELYDRDFRTIEYDAEVESAMGAVLYKESESIDNFHSMNEIVDEYVQFDIQKFFKLSLNDYLETNLFTRKILINKAIEIINKLNQQMEELKNKGNGETQDDFSDFDIT